MRRLRLLGAIFAGLLLAPAFSAPASAGATKLYPSGKLDFAYGSATVSASGPATGYKPESKLFYTPDGRWWAALGTAAHSPAGVHLFELVDHNWVDRYVIPGSDPWEKADTSFKDGHLLVSLRDQDASPQNELYELSYSNGSWSLVSGPTLITAGAPETVTIARDSVGRVWTTWEESQRVRVRYAPNATSPFTDLALPSSVGPINGDDISSVTTFGTSATGFKIGVMWSDQVSKRFYFAWRNDADPVATSSWHVETAYGGGVGNCPTSTSDACSDDHINIKTNGDEVYVAVKTSLNDATNANPDDPLIVLLRRNASGSWGAFPVSPVRQDASRPMVLLAPELNEIYVVAQRAFSTVQLWRSTYTNPSFNPDAVTPWASSTGGAMNDPTSTKQLITAASGAVVETSVEAQGQYWHNELVTSTPAPSPSPTPTATPTPTPTPSASPPAGTTTLRFAPAADASVRSDQPNTNFGSSTVLKTDGDPIAQSYLRFNVTGTNGRPVTSAKLRVNVSNPSPHGGDWHRVTGAWTEGGVTYNTRPSFDSAAFASLGAVTQGSSYEVNLGSLVKGDGQINVVSTSTAGDGVEYVSREGATTLRPELVVTLGSSSSTPSPAPTAAPVDLSFTANQDATLDSTRPSTALGSTDRLEVDQSELKRFLVGFNVSGVNGRKVTSARLQLYVVDPSNYGGDFHRVSSPWSESTVTWNNAPAFTSAAAGSIGAVSAGAWYEVDVTSAVLGDGQVSFLATSPSSNGADYSSREGNASFRPRLIVTVQ